MSDLTTDINSIQDAIDAYGSGHMVMVIDDSRAEPVGTIMCLAEHCSADDVNFMCVHARGIVCVGLSSTRCDALGLDLQPSVGASHTPAYTISVEAATGVTTGISAGDRARTIEVLLSDDSTANDLVSPGHVFPVQVHSGGVLGHKAGAEASVDLARLCGAQSDVGVFCDVLGATGELATSVELEALASEHTIPVVSMKQLMQHRMSTECLVVQVESGEIPTRYGDYEVSVWQNVVDGNVHVLLTRGPYETAADKPAPLVRLHSQCLTGDAFRSVRCDCGYQLEAAMEAIEAEESGAVLYLRQEGRGIGLVNKLKAYMLQDRGRDTVQANHELGFKADQRDYGIGAQILHQAGFRRIRLMTNNPRKLEGLKGFGLEVDERVPLIIEPCEDNRRYLQVKRDKLGHLFD